MRSSSLLVVSLIGLGLIIAGCGVDAQDIRLSIVTAENPRELVLAVNTAVDQDDSGVDILVGLLDADEVARLYLANVPGADRLSEDELIYETNLIRLAVVRGLADIGRFRAAQPLIDSAYPEGVEPLYGTGVAAEQAVRYRAEVVSALGGLTVVDSEQRREAIKMLEKATKDPAVEVRAAAAETLGALRLFEANVTLKELALDEHPAVRAGAVRAISVIAGHYLGLSFTGLEEETRAEAAGTLGALRLFEANVTLKELALDEHPAVRAAARAISVIAGHYLGLSFTGLEEETRAEAAENYIIFSRTTHKAIVEALLDIEPSVRLAAAEGLLQFPNPESIPPLIAAIDDPNQQVRITLINTLTSYTDPELDKLTTEECFAVLRDRDPVKAQHRMMAALLLGRMMRGGTEIVEALGYEDEFWFVRLQLINALANMNDPTYLGTVHSFIDDEDDDVAKAAVLAVGQLGNNTYIEELIELAQRRPFLNNAVIDAVSNVSTRADVVGYLADTHPKEVRSLAVGVLARLGDRQSPPPAELKAVLESGDIDLVEGALGAIRNYDLQYSAEALDAFLRRAFDSYDAFDTDLPLEELQAVLGRIYGLRISSSSMLASIGDRSGIHFFIDELDERNTTGANTLGTRLLAITALGRIGSDRGVMPVVAMLNEPEAQLRWAAAVVLATFADDRTIGFLTRNLDDPDIWTTTALVDALLAIGDKNTLRQVAQLLGPDNPPEVKLSALEFVAWMRDRAYNTSVAVLLADPDASVQLTAAQLLAGFGEDRGFDVFEAALRNESRVTLTEARPAESPFDYGLRLLASELKGLSNDILPQPRPDVSLPKWAAAVRYLTEMDNNRAYALLARALQEDNKIRREFTGLFDGRVASLTPHFSSTAYASFEPFLASADAELRAIGISVLTWIGSETAQDRLIAHLSDHPDEAPLIINALVDLGADTRMRELFRTAEEPVRVLIAEYLAQRVDKRIPLIWGQIATVDMATEPSLAVRWVVLPALATDTTNVGQTYLQLLIDNADGLYPPELQRAAAAALAGEPLPAPPVAATEVLEVAELDLEELEGEHEEEIEAG